MEASHKTHRPHIKVGKDEEKKKELKLNIVLALFWKLFCHIHRPNIRTRSSSTKEKLFNTLVRPHLEYAATVWDPHISKQKHSLGMAQRRAARWVTNRHHNTSSVTDMLHTRLDIPRTPPCYQQTVYAIPDLPWFYWHPTWSLYPPIQTYSTTLTSNRYAHTRNIPVQD